MSAIKPGDLVVCIRPQPCCDGTFGMWCTFTVAEVWTGQSRCTACGHMTDSPIAFRADSPCGGFLVSRLIKIEPQGQDETIETTEELTA
jgi:hypothetical protein